MFCDKCGNAIQPDQRFCSRCGREFAVAGSVGFARPGRVQRHLRMLGILWLAFSAWNVIGALFLLLVANTMFLHIPASGFMSDAPAWLHPFLASLGYLVAGKAVAGFLVAWGLLQREPWARILTIVMAFVALFNIPFGTAIGIYTLWVLLPAESDAEFKQEVRSMSAA
jgi:hypothetical protein